jgi:hypothetical protein
MASHVVLIVDIGLIVSKQQVRIVVRQTVDQWAEQIAITALELAGEDAIDDFVESGEFHRASIPTYRIECHEI